MISKWLGGSNAKDYKSGSVNIKCTNADEKMSVKKIYYLKENDKPIQVFGVNNPYAILSEQARVDITDNRLKDLVTSLVEENHDL